MNWQNNNLIFFYFFFYHIWTLASLIKWYHIHSSSSRALSWLHFCFFPTSKSLVPWGNGLAWTFCPGWARVWRWMILTRWPRPCCPGWACKTFGRHSMINWYNKNNNLTTVPNMLISQHCIFKTNLKEKITWSEVEHIFLQLKRS